MGQGHCLLHSVGHPNLGNRHHEREAYWTRVVRHVMTAVEDVVRRGEAEVKKISNVVGFKSRPGGEEIVGSEFSFDDLNAVGDWNRWEYKNISILDCPYCF